MANIVIDFRCPCSNDHASVLMSSLRPDLPNDVASCHAMIEQLQLDVQHVTEQASQWQTKVDEAEAKISHLEALLAEHEDTIATQQQTIEHLTGDNKLLRRSLFGSRRERYTDPSQTYLFDTTVVGAEASPSHTDNTPVEPRKKRTSKGRGRRVFPEFLPREEQKHFLKEEDIPEELRNDPDARRFFKKVGERIELIPMQLKVVEEYQEIIALDQPDATTTIFAASRPPSLIQSFAGTTLLAYLTVSRFADHLPYYRLENILGRSGIHIDRSTQWRWMHRVAGRVKPLTDLMWQQSLKSLVLSMDETPVKELGGPGTTLTGYLWCGVGDDNHPYDCFFCIGSA